MAEPKTQNDPLSGVGDLIGQVLGIPGRLAGEAGSALINSVRPDGKISILKLLNVGGIRDLEAKQRDMKMKSMELDNKIAEFNLGHAQRADIEHNIGLDPNTAASVAQALGMQQAQEAGTVQPGAQPQMSQEALIASGLAPELRAAREAAQAEAANTYAKMIGAPEVAGMLRHVPEDKIGQAAADYAEQKKNRETEYAQSLALIKARGKQQRRTAAARSSIRQQEKLQDKLQDPDLLLDIFKRTQRPTTMVTTEVTKGAFGDEAVTKRETVPITAKENKQFMRRALKTLDQMREGLSAQDGRTKRVSSIEENKARINTAQKAAAFAQQGLDEETSNFMALATTMPPQKVFAFKPKAAGLSVNKNYLHAYMTYLDKASQKGIPVDVAHIQATVVQNLVKQGYTVQEANALWNTSLAELRQNRR